MATYTNVTTAPFMMRFPDDVKEALAGAARAERRSMSNLILACLEPWLAARGYLPRPGTPKPHALKPSRRKVPQPRKRTKRTR